MPEMDLIVKLYRYSGKCAVAVFVTATEILESIARLNFQVGSRSNVQAIGKAMKYLGFKKESNYNDDKLYSEKGYFVELRITD
jgi:hypothetical protein